MELKFTVTRLPKADASNYIGKREAYYFNLFSCHLCGTCDYNRTQWAIPMKWNALLFSAAKLCSRLLFGFTVSIELLSFFREQL